VGFTDSSLYTEDWEPAMKPIMDGKAAFNVMGACACELTCVDKDSFSGDSLVTIDSMLHYNKYKTGGYKVEEHTQSHRRHFNVFRKAVLAS